MRSLVYSEVYGALNRQIAVDEDNFFGAGRREEGERGPGY